MRLLSLLLLAAFAYSAAAQPQSVVDQFEQRQHTFEGFTLPYRLFVPAGYDGSQAYPAVVAFHGSGERGTDNVRHIAVHRLATAWADPANQARNPAFVVAPQLPTTLRWTADAPVASSSFNIAQRAVLDLLDTLQVRYAIDPNRVYLTGLSLGGHATWDFVSRLPHRFAAAVPMSGNADRTQAATLMHLPLWIFHGESDTVVPAQGSRGIVFEMEKLGRDVIYTECRSSTPAARNYDCGPPLSADSLRRAIAAGADLFYTGVRAGGHGPWVPWYDNTIMQDWLFRQYRLDPDALALQVPAAGALWSGTQPVTWTTTGAATDTVRVALSLDDGETWQPVARVLNSGTFSLDTTPFADSPVARLRIEAVNAGGFVYARTVSSAFYLDNPGDGAPYLSLDTLALRFDARVTAGTFSLGLVAADPEQAPLTADLLWSVDGGATYTRFDTRPLASSQAAQTLLLDLAALPNTTTGRLRVDVTDGTHTGHAETPVFAKETPRVTGAPSAIERVSGEGRGTITLHVVDRNALTGHRYRIALSSADPAAKTYTVTDVNAGTTVLENVPLSDGIVESPAFDGLRLVVEDAETGMADLTKTRWTAGNSTLGVAVAGGRVRIAILTVTLLDTEDTYTFTMTETAADTSVAMYGIAATPMRFTITAASDGNARKAVFRDVDKDGRPGGGDVLYLLERNAAGALAPAWAFTFSSPAGTVPPQTGDVFTFVPLPKLGTGDVFSFVAATGVGVEQTRGPEGASLRSAPNPAAGPVRLLYHTDAPAHATLAVYDVLGRRVAVLADEAVAAGAHGLVWDGRGVSGTPLAAGTYLLRLTLRPLDGGPIRILHHPVVRVD